MTTVQIEYIIKNLIEKNVQFEKGLTDDEILKIEEKFSIIFPPDLKLFLQTKLPISEHFVHWRKGLKNKKIAESIIERIHWPLEGMLFDIERNNFWVKDWGEKPATYKSQKSIAKKHFETYPKLIPIYAHRYIPSEPNEIDNPIFSVYQMDIIYYGYNLADYFSYEFKFNLTKKFEKLTNPKKEIRFWDWCVLNLTANKFS